MKADAQPGCLKPEGSNRSKTQEDARQQIKFRPRIESNYHEGQYADQELPDNRQPEPGPIAIEDRPKVLRKTLPYLTEGRIHTTTDETSAVTGYQPPTIRNSLSHFAGQCNIFDQVLPNRSMTAHL